MAEEARETYAFKGLLVWGAGLFFLGLLWRGIRFALGMPLWGDEASVALNLIGRDFAGVFLPLDYAQVAPPLFLGAQWLVVRALGSGEWALRVLALAAGCLAVAAYWRLARLVLPPVAAVLAFGVFAVGYYPVRHSVELKPYAMDMLASVVLLWGAASILLRPAGPAGRLWLLTAWVPLALGFSYPAVFVAGAVVAVVTPVVARSGRRADWAAWAGLAVSVAGSFAAVYLLTAGAQDQTTGAVMRDYWADAFPPGHPWEAAKWLVRVHTGNLMAYPVGGDDGVSTATFVAVVIGLAGFWRSGRRSLVALLLLPFALTLVAAAMHRYPYGGSARVSLHLAPAICLMAGMGAWVLIRRIHHLDRRNFVATAVIIVLLGIGVGGIVRDIRKPYKTRDDQEVRRLVGEIEGRVAAGDVIRATGQSVHAPVNFQYALHRQRHPIEWGAAAAPVPRPTGACWVLAFDRDSADAVAMAMAAAGWRRTDGGEHLLQIGPIQSGPNFFAWSRWQPPTSPAETSP